MAWEDRNGKRYYYRKRRIGGRVVSQYLGAGALAEDIARLEELERIKRAADRVELEQIRAEWTIQSVRLNELSRLVDLLTRGALLTAGYHAHRGQWRLPRDGD